MDAYGSPRGAAGGVASVTGGSPGVVVRYWAAARAAAGTAEDRVGASTLAEALRQVRARHADRPRFAAVLAVCSLVVDGDPVGRRDPAAVALADGSQVEVLPPFAGGADPPAAPGPAGS